MTLCPIALAVGCQKCPVFKICPLKSVIGDQPKAAAEALKQSATGVPGKKVPAKRSSKTAAKSAKKPIQKPSPKPAAKASDPKPAAKKTKTPKLTSGEAAPKAPAARRAAAPRENTLKK